MVTLNEVRKLALPLTVETDEDGVETFYLGTRELHEADVVLLHVFAGNNTRWKEATVRLNDEHEEPFLQTNSGMCLLTSPNLLVRWPEEKEAS